MPADYSEKNAADAFAALGNRTRLRLVRLLVRAGPGGLAVGAIQERLKVPASTLAHHLATLARAGLVTQQKAGREVRTTAHFDRLRGLGDFLFEACCRGFDVDDADTRSDDVA
ncbi:ArsR/SmtB family transcription factor [Rhodobium gokarnense]|uniref:DNA-binding transcriptional ArsR family regulator n=1 Tax=Rhodobium gokarnense TaxID=364296 RepID=A0ABT3HHL3_9HYPH|nr:helix-turn-helix domain-containing protein [Rhodobium gokarnense]MCW2309872.1 DNA-binding transcriptional ArsR family regulator [Rhodobium gokarnense]